MRKANHCGYQLVSVPADPMAEPFTKKSDPLRGPIFIPLCVTFLPDGQSLFSGKGTYINIFKYGFLSLLLSVEFPEDTRSDRMLFLQEAILARFGFLPCVLEETNKDVRITYAWDDQDHPLSLFLSLAAQGVSVCALHWQHVRTDTLCE